jgi:Flp pilus assembly pilin Flp
VIVLLKLIRRFVSEELGLETVEYAIMTALLVAAVITAIGLLAAASAGNFGDVGALIDGIS